MNAPAPLPIEKQLEGAIEVTASWFYLGRPETPARVMLLQRTSRQRLWRTVDGLARCWALAVVAIFLPVLHFVLVPALVLAGPLVARSRWLERATVMSAGGVCPGCAAPLQLQPRQRAGPELSFRCPSCGRPLTLRIAPEVIENAGAPTEPRS